MDPHLVVAAWLAVELLIKNSTQAEDRREFKQVQAAKIIHRLASGTHKLWNSGTGRRTELHVYPASRGQVLRHIGSDLEHAVELLSDHRLPNIQAQIKDTKKASRAAPRPMSVRRRKVA